MAGSTSRFARETFYELKKLIHGPAIQYVHDKFGKNMPTEDEMHWLPFWKRNAYHKELEAYYFNSKLLQQAHKYYAGK